MDGSYTPVPWEYREAIEQEIDKKKSGKIFYFGNEELIGEASGRIMKLEEAPGKGLFVELDSNERIRIDRIITLFGKPGPAYDEYEAYGNACLDCTGGYDL